MADDGGDDSGQQGGGSFMGKLFGGGQQGEQMGDMAITMAFPEVGMALMVLDALMGGCDKGNENNENKTADQKIDDYDVDNDENTNDDQKQALRDAKDMYQSMNGDYSQAGRMGPQLEEVGNAFGNPGAGKELSGYANDLQDRYNENQNENENENEQENTNEQEENTNENEDLDNEA
ncbi:hypothetical protein HDU97_002446 [Phlyctochytrium planicorne]|nr:hypothetical protein HDU97_002446 [Phlyctochytrium planicorne]